LDLARRDDSIITSPPREVMLMAPVRAASIVAALLVLTAMRVAVAAPAAPTLRVGPVWTTEVDLHWSTPDDPSTLTFKIERSTDGASFAQVASVQADTAGAVGGLDPATAYWFRVRASGSTGTSPYSNVVQATTHPCGASLFVSGLADLASTTGSAWCGTPASAGEPSRALLRNLDLPPCASGDCDAPATRDATPVDAIELRVIVHVVRESDGTGGTTAEAVDSMMAQINRDFAPLNIHVRNLGTQFHDDSRYATLTSREQLAALKDTYAQTPSQNLNIFTTVSGLPFDGMGIYPWDADALTAQGGIWLNRDLVDGAHHSASHELGHCLGLYHTFHGTDEVESCADACYEPASGVDADRRGDFCSDTRSTPRNFSCTDPTGCDCTGTPWSNTPVHDIMGYAPWWCANQFTAQQQHRMHCWARAALGSMIAVVAGVEPPGNVVPAALWTGAIGEPGGRARVWFATPAAGHVSLALFDVRGRRVVTLVDREETSGRHALQWDGHDGAGRRVSPGVYWLRLSLGNQSASGRLVLAY